MGKDAGVDENDPLLLRALEAQQKAIYPVADPSNWRTNWASWLDMQEAIYDFMEAHLKIKQGWPQRRRNRVVTSENRRR
jgi:hypothetical protein